MITFLKRRVLVNGKEVRRNVVVKQGVATVTYGSVKQVVKCSGSASDKSALWRVA